MTESKKSKKAMTPLDRARLSLLRFAAKAYGEPLHENSVQWKHGCIWIDDDLPYAGDTLALFLLRELNDVTFGAVDETALHSTAIQGLNTAIRDLERVRDALMTRRIETDQTEIKEEATATLIDDTSITIEDDHDLPVSKRMKLEEKALAKISGKFKRKRPKDPLAGFIYRFPWADGYALYVVVSGSPLKFQHIAVGDAWKVPYAYIRGTTTEDVRRRAAACGYLGSNKAPK